MKPFIALVGGFAVSLGMFVGGALLAAFILKADPVERPDTTVDVAKLWTAEPRPVDVDAQDLQRLPAAPQAGAEPPDAAATQSALEDGTQQQAAMAVDPQTTASVAAGGQAPSETEADPAPANTYDDRIIAAHLDWCASRYRSYRASDNSYRPYSGGRRECVSPHLEEAYAALAAGAAASDEGPGAAESPVLQYASDETGGTDGLSSAHSRDCMARYRSYDPRDNSYQPYGGGPRRQCE